VTRAGYETVQDGTTVARGIQRCIGISYMVQCQVEEYRAMVLQSEILEGCLQGDIWMETLGIPLGVVHPRSTRTQMSDTRWYPLGLRCLSLLYITHRHRRFGCSPLPLWARAAGNRELTRYIGMTLNILGERLLSGGIGLVHELTTIGWGMR